MFERTNVIGVLLMVAVVVVGSFCAPFISQAYSSEDPPPAGSILFFIRNSQTHYGIGNATIKVYKKDKLITTIDSDDSGYARFEDSKEGRYEFKISAGGFRSVETHYALAIGTEFNVELLMTPIVTSKELEDAYLNALDKDAKEKSEVAIVGFITDNKTGRPIEGVRVFAVSANVEITSDERGFYTIRFHAPPPSTDSSSLPPLETVTFEKKGYVTYEYQNYFVLPGVGGFNVTLEHGSGKKINKNPNRRLQPIPYPDSKTKSGFNCRCLKNINPCQMLCAPWPWATLVSPSILYHPQAASESARHALVQVALAHQMTSPWRSMFSKA